MDESGAIFHHLRRVSDYEHKLVKFSGYLANDTWTEHEYDREKRKVLAAKDQIDARIPGLQGQSVLDRLGGQVKRSGTR